jgi:hypothetical protein
MVRYRGGRAAGQEGEPGPMLLGAPTSFWRRRAEPLATAPKVNGVWPNLERFANQFSYNYTARSFWGYEEIGHTPANGYGTYGYVGPGIAQGFAQTVAWEDYSTPVYFVPANTPRQKVWLVIEETGGPEETLSNLTAPTPVTNAELSRTLGRVLHRPAVLPVPGLALQLLYGEMASIVLTGARVLPARLRQLGYDFAHPELEGALRDVLSGR